MIDGEILRRAGFLATASDASMAHLRAHAKRQRLCRGDFLFHEGDACTGCWVIVSGVIVAERHSLQGRRLILHVAGPDETAGHVDIANRSPRRVSARALADTEVIALGIDGLSHVLKTDPAVTLALSRDLADIVGRLGDIAADLAFSDVTHRLAKLLLERSAENAPQLTQGELAAKLAGSRQSVNVALASMARAGLVRLSSAGGVIWIDARGLSELLGAG